MLKAYYSFFSHQTWTPAVNLYETSLAYLVCVDLAGVEKEKIDIEVAGPVLTIRGTRMVPPPLPRDGEEECERPRMHVMEVDHGPFARVVELPADVQNDRITARKDDGMLWIDLPKKSAVRKTL